MGTNLASLWTRLSRVQRIALAGLTTLAVIMMVVFATWARTPDYAVAFKGLDADDAAEVVASLKEKGYPYRLGDDGSILVPRNALAEVRLAMAAEGLPKGGAIGFELFDASNLGMSEFYQEVNYRRALEGELARTIASLDAVDQVRVHLVIPQQSLYASQRVDPTASIMIRLAPGASLTKAQIRAIRYLVAGSVEGLDPDNLAIVDTQGNTLASGAEDVTLEQALEISSQQLEIQRAYERTLEAKVQSMLEQLVGPGRAVVQAQVTMDWNRVESVSETYAPGTGEGVLRSSQDIVERYKGTESGVGGIPGADTNLPPAPDSPMPASEASLEETGDYAREESLRNYEVSRVETHSSNAPGRVERLAVSVLIDGITDAQHLSDIQEAVSAAVGFDAERGDVVSVKGMPFDRSYYEAEAEAMEQAARERLYVTIGKYAGLAILVLVLLLYIRGLLNGLRPTPMRVERPSLIGLPEGDRLEQLSAQRARQLSPTELARALQSGTETTTAFKPDPRLETLIRKQSEAREALAVPLPDKTVRDMEDARMSGIAAAFAEIEDDDRLDAEQGEASLALEARQRLQRQVTALARNEPHAIAQVVRNWLLEGK
ncbi:MAG TPA: flagellar M-ring protein FliF [Chloroflexi bacterium]|nr:flagellar M-ring protein FliF [Chloroflexota bacterium]